MNNNGMMEKEEIFSKVLRAGRRTYFFDVRATKADDYYLTITESKKLQTTMDRTTTKNIKSISIKKILPNLKKF